VYLIQFLNIIIAIFSILTFESTFFSNGACKSAVRPKVYWQFTKNWKQTERTKFTYFGGGITPLVAPVHISPPIQPRNGNEILHCSGLYQIYHYPGAWNNTIGIYIVHSKSTLQYLTKNPPTDCPSRREDIARLYFKVEVTHWNVQILNGSTVVLI